MQQRAGVKSTCPHLHIVWLQDDAALPRPIGVQGENERLESVRRSRLGARITGRHRTILDQGGASPTTSARLAFKYRCNAVYWFARYGLAIHLPRYHWQLARNRR